MNYGAEPADQVVRYTLEGTEFALKISGTAAKNFAVFALAVLRDQKKTHGKTKLVRLLREGKPLKFFSVPTDQMRDLAKAAKAHGLVYVPIRDRSDPDNIEIAVWAEDAAKVNRVIDKLQLDVVDTGEAELVADVQKGQSQPVPEKETIETEHGAVSFAVGESEEQFNMDFTPAPKQSDLETTALGRKNPSEPSSPNKGPLPDTPSPRADKIRANGQRPSVRRELGDIRVFLRQRDDARAQHQHGREQAERAGEHFRDFSFDRYFCSDLVRTRETFEHIFGQRDDCEYTELLREANSGELAGMKYTECAEKYGERYAQARKTWSFRQFGGDDVEDLFARARGFLKKMEELPKDVHTVAAVTHAGTMRTLAAAIVGGQMPGFPMPIFNCACCVLRLKDNGQWCIVHWNIETPQHFGEEK